MTNKMIRWMLVVLLAISGVLAGAGVAAADIENTDGTNLQDGDNSATTNQTGNSDTGDAVGGQVTGVVSSGDASVNARNDSEDVDLETGASTGNNTSSSFVGLNSATSTNVSSVEAEDIECDEDPCDAVNAQDGDNELDISQATSANSGDGVGGQVVGIVTSRTGSASLVAANDSEDVDIETGETSATNDAAAFVGLNVNTSDFDGLVVEADLENVDATNLQDGDNELSGDQSAEAASGDGVGGSVLGVVAGGDVSMNANNDSEDIDIDTGDSTATNEVAKFVGLNVATSTNVDADAADVEDSFGTNLQDGDNESEFDQSASASSGDAVGGQVAGVVTTAGGSAGLVLDNSSEDVDGESGEATHSNTDEGYVGLNFNTDTIVI